MPMWMQLGSAVESAERSYQQARHRCREEAGPTDDYLRELEGYAKLYQGALDAIFQAAYEAMESLRREQKDRSEQKVAGKTRTTGGWMERGEADPDEPTS